MQQKVVGERPVQGQVRSPIPGSQKIPPPSPKEEREVGLQKNLTRKVPGPGMVG